MNLKSNSKQLQILLSIFFAFFCNNAIAQEVKPITKGFNVYNEYANPENDIAAAAKIATKNKKHIMVIVGGNWCIWCKRLNDFIINNDTLKNELNTNFEVVHINYSKQNKNQKILNKLNNPEKNGFPVIVILNQNGKYLSTQNTGALEKGSSYDQEKIMRFFQDWSYKKFNKQ